MPVTFLTNPPPPVYASIQPLPAHMTFQAIYKGIQGELYPPPQPPSLWQHMICVPLWASIIERVSHTPSPQPNKGPPPSSDFARPVLPVLPTAKVLIMPPSDLRLR